jgi:hypothetical protein
MVGFLWYFRDLSDPHIGLISSRDVAKDKPPSLSYREDREKYEAQSQSS